MRARGLAWWLAALAAATAAPAPAAVAGHGPAASVTAVQAQAASAPPGEPGSAAAPAAPGQRIIPFDPAHTRVGFRLRTRWGQQLRGEFPVHAGSVLVHADGRRQVRVQLDSTRMVVVGHPRYTRWARGGDFFDVDRFPVIEFVSEAYDASLLREGGALHGTLTMRGISRPVRFALDPAACARPGRDCDVVAGGTVDRGDFGMEGWRAVVGDDVRFDLRMRTRGDVAEP